MTDQPQACRTGAAQDDDIDQRAAFALLLQEKLLEADAPEPLMQIALSEADRMAGQYRPEDPADVARLNSKLLHLLDVANSRPDPAAPFEAMMERMIREVMRRK
jgi:hypothetical protein